MRFRLAVGASFGTFQRQAAMLRQQSCSAIGVVIGLIAGIADQQNAGMVEPSQEFKRG
jgi:hypothetical protein